jgi:hypothetical protein
MTAANLLPAIRRRRREGCSHLRSYHGLLVRRSPPTLIETNFVPVADKSGRNYRRFSHALGRGTAENATWQYRAGLVLRKHFIGMPF